MRSTYGNKLGGIPRSNIRVPADETRYSTVLKPDGTRDKLTDWQLYFKKEEEGGLLPEYINDLVRSIPDGADSLNESGEFDFGNIMYSFRDIRLVPLHDEFNNRVTTQIAGYTIPDRWDLVADVYLYLKRDVVIESQGQSVITEYMSGILQPDLLLATGQLEYSLKPCSNGKNYVDWYYKFLVDEIESLSELEFKQLSKNTGVSVTLRDRILQDVTIEGTVHKIVPLAIRGTVPKGHGVLPLSGEYTTGEDKEITWDGFTPDSNQIRLFKPTTPPQPALKTLTTNWIDALKRSVLYALKNAGIEKHDRPITQNIVWQTIWKAWSGAKYDGVSIDITDPRLDDDITRYDGALLPLEVDGFPINSEFASGYYLPRAAKWLRVSKKLLDGAYPNICRGKTSCSDVLPSDDCSKVPFAMIDAKRRIDTEKYKFISKDTSKYYSIPGKPCYQGLPATYERTSVYEYTASKDCFDGKVDINGRVTGERKKLFRYSTKTEVNTVIEWENIIRNTIDATCECYELSVQNPPCIDPNDPYGCNIMYTDTIYTICPDDGAYYYINREIPPTAVPTRLEIRAISDHECHDDTRIAAYYPIKLDTDVLNSMPVIITDGAFESEPSLSMCQTSSIQNENSKKYYTDVIANNESNNDIQFSLIYANKLGFGSPVIGERTKDATSRSNYTQYNLLLSEEDYSQIIFYTNGTASANPDEFYAINFNNKTIKDRIDVGNFEMSLMDLSGSSDIITLIDNSMDITNNKYYTESPYFSFDLVSGSLLDGIYENGQGNSKTNITYTTYGSVYPNLGVILLDSHQLNSELNFTTITSSNVFARNELNLFTSISGAMELGHPMYLRNSVRKVSTHYFARIPVGEANYSNNPTFSDTTNNGIINNKRFAINPVTYVTTLGLYNDSNDLLAIGKLSTPIKKTKDSELLLSIKLTI